MKTIQIIAMAALALLFNSCATTFYQVYQTTPSENLTRNDQNLTYNDDHCQVIYNLWEETGNMDFTFVNKTDHDLYLHLDKSFFIFNKQAYDYFQNRYFASYNGSSSSTTRSASVSKSITGLNYLQLLQTNGASASGSKTSNSSSGYAVANQEERIICIPAHAQRTISEYSINELLYRHCDLLKYPSPKQVKTLYFDKSESPMVFGNRITYSAGDSEELIRFENQFYVSEITNYPMAALYEQRYEEVCGQKSVSKINFIKGAAPDKFYIKYTKGSDTWKH